MKFEPNASDFFAVSKEAAEVLRKNYREKVRFLRGYVQSIGFQKATITYEAHDRIAGESKYSLRKLLAFSMNTIMCFSNLPLKLGIYAGAFAGLLGVAVMVYTLFTPPGRAQRLRYHRDLKLLYVRDLVSDRGHYRRVYRDSVQRAKDGNLYRGRNTRMWRRNLCKGKENPPGLCKSGGYISVKDRLNAWNVCARQNSVLVEIRISYFDPAPLDMHQHL